MKQKKLLTLAILTTTLFSNSLVYINKNEPILSNQQSNKKRLNLDDEVLDGKTFVDTLNNLSPGSTYELTSDVDLSNLTINDRINLNKITLNGNGHKIYNRRLNDEKKFTINNESDERKLYLFETITNDSIINNLTFDNVLFPIYLLDTSHLVNVKFENTTYQEMNFILKATELVFDQEQEGGDIDLNVVTIGLFILKVENSTFENIVIENLIFNNNNIKNEVDVVDREETIIIAPIGYIKEETHDSIINTPTNTFENIYINHVEFKENNFNGKLLFDYINHGGHGSFMDYGNVSSIILTPTLGGIIGYKTNDSYAKVTSKHIVINDITFDSNTSEITGNEIYSFGLGQGIFYSLGSVVNLGNQSIINDTMIFNLNIKLDPDDINKTLFLSGFINTLNNYDATSKAFVLSQRNFYYQEDLLKNLVGATTILLQQSSYENILENMIIGDSSIDNNWDRNIWSKEKNNTGLEEIKYHQTPWIDANYQYGEKETILDGRFRNGSFKETQWKFDINDENGNTFYSQDELNDDTTIKKSFITEKVLDPNKNISFNFSTGSKEELINFSIPIDSSQVVPKITNVVNKTINEKGSNRLVLTINFINNFNYSIKFQSSLYKKGKLIEANYKTLIDSSEDKITFISKSNFDLSETFEDYYYDINITFINQNKEETKIYDSIINFDEDSIVAFSHYQKGNNWIIIGSSILLLILLILIIILIVFLVKRKKANIKLEGEYKEITGIELVENN